MVEVVVVLVEILMAGVMLMEELKVMEVLVLLEEKWLSFLGLGGLIWRCLS